MKPWMPQPYPTLVKNKILWRHRHCFLFMQQSAFPPYDFPLNPAAEYIGEKRAKTDVDRGVDEISRAILIPSY